jgi:hypothetical protein
VFPGVPSGRGDLICFRLSAWFVARGNCLSAQSRTIERFDVTMPVVLPRMSATIIENSGRVGLGHEVSEFSGDIEALINKHFEHSFP